MDISAYKDYEAGLSDPVVRLNVEIRGTPQVERISVCCGAGQQVRLNTMLLLSGLALRCFQFQFVACLVARVDRVSACV
jgi:hypothetical protein